MIGTTLKRYLDQPYPFCDHKWNLILSISLFVGLFMLIFRPFGLSEYNGAYKAATIFGYGGLAFIVLIINLFFIPFLLPSLFDMKAWTVLKQIGWLGWVLFTIGLANYMYSSIIFSTPLNLYDILRFQLYTISVGIIPIVVLTIIKQNLSLSQNLKIANQFNNSLQVKEGPAGIQDQLVCVTAENTKDKFEIKLSDLWYIEAYGNYIRIFYSTGSEIKTILIRSTLKRMEAQLKEYKPIVKCHRAYLVNVNKIVRAKGNSQGLKLILDNTGIQVPASRNFSRTLRSKIALS